MRVFRRAWMHWMTGPTTPTPVVTSAAWEVNTTDRTEQQELSWEERYKLKRKKGAGSWQHNAIYGGKEKPNNALHCPKHLFGGRRKALQNLVPTATKQRLTIWGDRWNHLLLTGLLYRFWIFTKSKHIYASNFEQRFSDFITDQAKFRGNIHI